ncbi:MAG: phosphoenolpyruvate--protein phosphotransferase [Kiritimatiellia bacterium]|jgi:phosphoenolpyruvate-protein kinase (PTS system EI component)
MSENKPAMLLSGKALSPGLGMGATFIYRDVLTRFDEFYDIAESQVEEELKRLEKAIRRISDDLNVLIGRVKREMDSDLSGVFQAHIAMVQDASLKAEVEKEIRGELVSAGAAVRTVFRRWERRFRAMEAEVARQKGDDMRDLARRLVSSLAGIRSHGLENLPHGSVLVANRLLPSDTVFLSFRGASAAILEAGGAGSHAALFAREIGLPCVAGLPGVVEAVPPGALALVDADAAEVIVNPSREQVQAFESKCRLQKLAASEALVHVHEPAVTKDGRVITVLANVAGPDDTKKAMENGAAGVGLYRIEQAYLGHRAPPEAAELLEEMQKTLAPVKGLPVYVRLLDVGADKPLPFMESFRESNPSLGRRGIRFLLEYPDLLQTQLDALLRLSAGFDLNVLVPMVTLPGDMQKVRDLLLKSAARLGISPAPKLGAMIETPAAALAAADIVQYAEFLSFGTNDLTQYSFAADRENAAVDAYFDDTRDVIFRLLRIVHDDVPHIPLSICGELAGRPKYTARLLECGIVSLSVAPPLIPSIKEAIRKCGGA